LKITSGLMFQTILFYLLVFPIIEYLTHYFLHIINNSIHKKHHIKYHTNNYSIEKTPIILSSIFIYFQYYHSAICLLIYWCIHTIIHIKPQWVPILYKHHHLHHIHNHSNYAVSSIWPDYLFNTIKK
jgi:hypothetical protein